MKKLVLVAVFTALGSITTGVWSQIPGTRIPPRVEDHFWRRKVMNRIDLTEKINEPLTLVEDPSLYQYGTGPYGERQGIVVSLINGLKSGKYLGYKPDSLNKALTYEEVVVRAKLNEEGTTTDANVDDTEDSFEDFDATDDEFGPDDAPTDDITDEGDTDPVGGKAEGDFGISNYESILDFIEDEIFDKNRSDMVFDIQYLVLVWTDPSGTLADKPLVAFKYSDIVSTLENTQWKNKYNDAEYRNMREVFEYRLFHSIVTSVSGRGVRTLEEADFRRNQITEFEHHLWCY